MKFIFFLLLVASICNAETSSKAAPVAKTKITKARAVSSEISKEDLAAKFATYVHSTSETIDGNVEQDVQDFVKLRLNAASDFVLVQNVLLTLVKLDKEDPSRAGLQILSQSYVHYKKLYQRAFQTIKSDSNAEVLKEMEDFLTNFASNGNG